MIIGDASAQLGIILGILTPFLVSLVNQPRWSAQARQIIALVVAVGVGVVTVVLTGQWDGTNLLTTIAVVLGASQAVYTLLLKPTGVAKQLENVTSLDAYRGRRRSDDQQDEAA